MVDNRDESLKKEGITDSLKGKATEAKGKVKDAVGGLTGNPGMQAEGKVDQLKGKAQDTLGKVEREIDKESKDANNPNRNRNS